MGNFRNLEVWQKAHQLTLRIYKLTMQLPGEEKFVLTPQLRRAAISVESNIAEGDGRFHKSDKLKFFIDARASLKEVQTQLLIIEDVYDFLKAESKEIFDMYETLGKQMTSLISYRRSYAS